MALYINGPIIVHAIFYDPLTKIVLSLIVTSQNVQRHSPVKNPMSSQYIPEPKLGCEFRKYRLHIQNV